MKIRLKSAILVILSAAILLSSSGCGGSGNGRKIISNSKTELESFMNLTGLPIVKEGEEAELTVFTALNDNAADINSMPWTSQTEKSTGVKINWITHSSSIAGDKLKQLLLSGELPDVVLGTVTAYSIVEYMDQSLFRPVDDLIDNYMPNLTAVYEKRPEYKAMMTAPDGKIYGFPSIEEMEGMTLVPGPIYVYKPWVDALGLSLPKTLDELRNYMVLVRDNDMNNNGADDEIPFTFQLGGWDSYEGYHQLLACFGLNDTYSHITVMNGKVVNTTTLDAFKTGIDYIHQMYADGLIDDDAFTSLPSGDPRSRIMTKLNASEVTIGAVQLYDTMNEIYISERRSNEYVPLGQLTGPDGSKASIRFNSSELSTLQAVITTDCQYPELAARWIDYMYDPEQSVYANWGTLDYVYVKDSEGILRWDVDKNGSPNLKQGYNSIAEMRFASTIALGPSAILNEYYDTVLEYPRDAQKCLDAAKGAGLEDTLANTEYYPPVWYTQEEQAVIAQYGNYITNLMDSTVTNWMIEGGVNESWDDYQKQLKDASIDKLMKVYQDAYDRYKETMSKVK